MYDTLRVRIDQTPCHVGLEVHGSRRITVSPISLNIKGMRQYKPSYLSTRHYYVGVQLRTNHIVSCRFSLIDDYRAGFNSRLLLHLRIYPRSFRIGCKHKTIASEQMKHAPFVIVI